MTHQSATPSHSAASRSAPGTSAPFVERHRRWSVVAIVVALVGAGVLLGGVLGLIGAETVAVVLDHLASP